MKRWIQIIGVLLMVLVILYSRHQQRRHSLRAAVDETRRQLRQQGFKLDLADFDFTLPAEINARATGIIAAGQAVRSLRDARELQFMRWVGTNVAVAISRVEIIQTHGATNLWPLVHQELASHQETLDAVCASLLAGPVKFQPVIRPSRDILLPYLADYKILARVLAIRAVLAMHEHHTNGVFTNIFALSRLVTGWTPEPFEITHLARSSCAGIAQQAIWESMQTDYCSEAELAALQREWESARFFDHLGATAEASCADIVRVCQAARNESYGVKIGGWGPIFPGVFSSPVGGFQNLWQAIQGYRQHANYQNRGSYEDEKALLLYYVDRRDELKRAIACSSWSEMRTVPGVTNIVVFQGAKPSGIGSRMNLKQVTLGFQGQGRSLAAAVAEAEARRRLIVTAIALKRFAIHHGVSPQSLAELVPALVPALPRDFMDGKELRYRRGKDGRYLLYSVGLDCVDNGGAAPNRRRRLSSEGVEFLPQTGADLVWPLPATQADVVASERPQGDRKGVLERNEFPGTLEGNP